MLFTLAGRTTIVATLLAVGANVALAVTATWPATVKVTGPRERTGEPPKATDCGRPDEASPDIVTVVAGGVEEFCSKEEWQRAYEEINSFEKLLVDDGVPILKFFLHVSADEQLKRFEARKEDPFRSWKLTDDDWRNREKRDEYAEAIDDMFEHTHTKTAPWYAISSEHKWFGRVAVLEACVDYLCDYFTLDPKLPEGWKKLRD